VFRGLALGHRRRNLERMTGPTAHAEILAGLNANQRAAAEHAQGPLLVVAGAGTGKTKTLAARVACLIRRGADPHSILLLTFTRRAAGEMIRRAGQFVGESLAAGVWGGTFHAVAHRLLRIHSQSLGLASSFTIMDQGDAEDLLHLIRTDLGLHQAKTRFPRKGTLLSIYSRCVNTGEPLEQALADRFPWCHAHLAEIKQIFREYGDRKSQRGLLDYDDLLLYWDQALELASSGDAIAGRFEHVLVDEYQDTNPIQSSLLRKLWGRMRKAHASPSRPHSIMVVGDDAQSIYSFRGATVENILRFPDDFPGTTTVTLNQNYRSTTPILHASNAVMQAARRRFTKDLWSERPAGRKPALITCADEIGQSSLIADLLLEHREEGIPLVRQAVLFRAGHNSDALEVELSRRNIPFVKWGGLKFLEAAHIKDLLAFLRILENPHDELSWMRILQMLDGIGPGRARQALEHVRQAGSVYPALRTWKAPPAARSQVDGLAELFCDLAAQTPEPTLPVQIDRVRRFYLPVLERRYEQPEMRLRDLEQLELLAQHATSRAAFLADLTLDPPASTGDLAGPPQLDEEYTILSTIHSAKGCEWDVVYLIHAADGILPSDMSIGEAELEEERRLLYVAMTRARDRLYVTFPLRYYHRRHPLGDAHSFAQLSRFLAPELFPLFDCSGFERPPQDPGPVACEDGAVAESVQARVKRLWQ
jgi:DNA helicase-2/ATP-dependent DNA helicase PcrA